MNSPELELGTLLRMRRLTLAVAESCTGGLLGSRITDAPGSSDYFIGGILAYANSAKVSLLGVPAATLERFGAVSRETVIAMAQGARRAVGVDLALSVSGIAGPGGGTPDKPTGTTWIGLAAPDGAWARHFCWDGDRKTNKAASAEAALLFLLDYLRGQADLDRG
jgi:PncC family amidohydrolase